jgi:hypothetical protein
VHGNETIIHLLLSISFEAANRLHSEFHQDKTSSSLLFALAFQVTNCGEGMDNRAVATILSGLSQCGEAPDDFHHPRSIQSLSVLLILCVRFNMNFFIRSSSLSVR